MEQGTLSQIRYSHKKCLCSNNSFFSLSKYMRKCRKGREVEPCASYQLESHVVKQPCNCTEALSVDKEVDVEHDMLSDCFSHDTKSRAAEAPESHLWSVKKFYCSVVEVQWAVFRRTTINLPKGRILHFYFSWSVEILKAMVSGNIQTKHLRSDEYRPCMKAYWGRSTCRK